MFLIAGLPGFRDCSRAAEKPAEASQTTQRLLERSKAVAQAESAPRYSYEKRSVLQHLNAAGKPEKSEEKIYEVTLVAGYPLNRLVKIQGREVTPEESKKEQLKEEAFWKKLSSSDAKKKAGRKEAWVTPELLGRYEFAVQRTIVVSNRPTTVLTFKPRQGKLPCKTFGDKLLNRLEGTLWIDQTEAEVAKLSVHLTESLSVGWFGVLGSLSRCDLSLERQRMPDGTWINAAEALQIQFRKVTATTRLRYTEESSGFKKLEVKG